MTSTTGCEATQKTRRFKAAEIPSCLKYRRNNQDCLTALFSMFLKLVIDAVTLPTIGASSTIAKYKTEFEKNSLEVFVAVTSIDAGVNCVILQ